MGDPDEEKVKALVQPAVTAGAEYFVIDAGWYADETDWWDTVGEWEPSTRRFPSGSYAGEDQTPPLFPVRSHHHILLLYHQQVPKRSPAAITPFSHKSSK